MINIEEEIAKLKDRVAFLERLLNQSPTIAASNAGSKKLSIKEFMLSKPAKSSTQLVLIAAYYLEKYNQHNTFHVPDLSAIFEQAKQVAPGNINGRINDLISQGLVMKAKEKKDNKAAWTLTASGEKAIESLT